MSNKATRRFIDYLWIFSDRIDLFVIRWPERLRSLEIERKLSFLNNPDHCLCRQIVAQYQRGMKWIKLGSAADLAWQVEPSDRCWWFADFNPSKPSWKRLLWVIDGSDVYWDYLFLENEGLPVGPMSLSFDLDFNCIEAS